MPCRSKLGFPLRRARVWRVAAVLLCGLLGPAAALRATTVVPPTFTQLVGRAEYVVRGVVKSVNCEWRDRAGNRQIITRVEVEVREVISGLPPAPLVLVFLGGKIGDEEMRVDGTPQFRVGDEDILFVRGNGRQFSPLVALMHGHYLVKNDAAGQRYVARSNGAPLYAESEVAKELAPAAAVRAEHAGAQPMSPESFAKAVRQMHEAIQQQPGLAN